MNRKNKAQQNAARKSVAIMLGLALSGTAVFLWVNRGTKTEPVKRPAAPQPEQVVPAEPQPAQVVPVDPQPELQPPVIPKETITLGESRIWTSLDGNRASAKFIALDGNILLLKKGTQNIRVPLDTFIETDQTYARQCAQAIADAQQRIAEALLDESIPVHPDQPHTWTRLNGQTAVATFNALEDGSLALIKEYKTIRIPMDELTEADQLYARRCAQQLKRKAQAMQNAPLQLFGRENYQGKQSPIQPHLVYSGSEIPSELILNISSLILRKGYQATIATAENGLGLSKVLIAAQRDIRIPRLSKKFNNSIQFIRVLPWKDSIKKGHGGSKDLQALTEGWFYNWTGGHNVKDASLVQFVPMAFSHHKTKNTRWVEDQINQTNITHILGFNEPDSDAHTKNRHLVMQENSVQAMMPLMGIGLRIGGPACKEEGIRVWIPDFMKEAEDKKLRIDFIGVHWYDYGGKPSVNIDASAGDIFNRFKDYIEGVYQQYKMPIWITEFNANRFRNENIQLRFLKLALPYMDSLNYVERYAYFQPRGGHGSFRDKEGELTPIGIFWRDHKSVPAMNEEVYLGENNLCKDEKEE